MDIKNFKKKRPIEPMKNMRTKYLKNLGKINSGAKFHHKSSLKTL